MPDLSQLSTKDLIKMRDAAKAQAAPISHAPSYQNSNAGSDLSKLSTEELMAMRDKAAPASNEPPIISGALGSWDRMKLGFASSQEEKEAALQQKYPGVKFAEIDGDRVVKLPGETTYKRFDAPGLEFADLADMVGDIPNTVGSIGGGLLGGTAGSVVPGVGTATGAIAGSAAGAGLGEAVRKGIGHHVLGIPNKTSLAEDVKDVGFAAGTDAILGALPVVGKAGFGKLKGLLGKKAVQGVEKSVLKEGAEVLGKEAVNTPNIPLENPNYAGFSLDDLEKRVAENDAKGLAKEMPQAAELDDALKRLPELQNRPMLVHRQMAENKANRATLGTQIRENFGDGVKTATNLNQYENQIKQEANNLVDDLLDNQVGTGRPKSESLKDSGQNALDTLQEIYKAEKTGLGPEFEKFQAVRFPKANANTNLKSRIYESFPELDQYLEPGPGGELSLSKWNAAMPITKQEHAAISEALESVNAGRNSVKELQSIRANVRANIDPAHPNQTRNLSRFNSAVLEHIKNTVEAQNPAFDVRGAFQNYAVNEQKREAFEKLLGVRLDGVKSEFQQAPERVLNKVFANSKNAKLTKEFVGPEAYADMVGDWISANRKSAGTSATKFNSFLKKNSEAIIDGVGPEKYQKLVDATTVQRFTSDLAPFNTSGTDTARNIRLSGNPIDMAKSVLEVGKDKLQQGAKKKELSETLQKGLPSAKKKGLLERTGEKIEKADKYDLRKRFLKANAGAQTSKGERQNE